MLQQDGMPSHTGRNTLEWTTCGAKMTTSSCLRCDWQPNSLVDHAVWKATQKQIYHGRQFEMLEQLKQAIDRP